MASYFNRKGRISALVRIKRMPYVGKTFATMEEAREWATKTESEIRKFRAYGCLEARLTGGGFRSHPRTKKEVLALPRLRKTDTFCGIYFLIRNNVCVYVGQSTQIHVRVREHKTKKTVEFDSYSWTMCEPERLNTLEQHYIDLLKPERNVLGTPKFKEQRRQLYARKRGYERGYNGKFEKPQVTEKSA